MHSIIRTLRENLVLHVAGTKSVKGREKSMFSVSPQAARYTADKEKEKKNSLLTSIKFSIKNALNIQNKQNQRLKLSPKQTLKQLTENLARLWRKRSIPVATKTTNQYQFSLLVFVLMKRRLNLIFRKFSPFSCCLVEQSIQLCWLAAQIISN